MKTIHIAEVVSKGGRDGILKSPEAGFYARLSSEEKSDSLTPEHLFAGAYAACFLGAIKHAAQDESLPAEDATVVARAHLEEAEDESYQLAVELRATLPGVSQADALHLLERAHETCPYSKATRGNITVTLAVDS